MECLIATLGVHPRSPAISVYSDSKNYFNDDIFWKEWCIVVGKSITTNPGYSFSGRFF
jgi:hypothetical protein